MARRTPLPQEVPAAFSVATALDADIPYKRLRAGDLEVPTRGVRRRAGQPMDLRARCAAFALALPADAAFSHLTAARLLDLPTPAAWPGPEELLDVMRDRSRNPVLRSGCRGHRGLETRSVVVRGGLRVTSPVDTWCDLAGLWSRPDLLAAADLLLRRSHIDARQLVDAADARRGRRHAADLVAMAPLARAGSASPGESRARYSFFTWGLPEPELNAPVLDAHGQWLATSDFLWRGPRVVGEYDGDVHRTNRRRWQLERERRASLEDAGYRYVEMTALTLVDPCRAERLRARLTRLLSPGVP
jgi:hypothetical protein